VKPVISSPIAKQAVVETSNTPAPSADKAPVERQSSPVFVQTPDAKPEISTLQAADTKLVVQSQPAARFAATVETKSAAAAAQSTSQAVFAKPQGVPVAPPAQNVKFVIAPSITAQPSIDTKIVSQETQTSDASPAVEQSPPTVSAQTRDTKQEPPERPAASRDVATASTTETQAQPAQLVIDTSAIAQPVLAAPVVAATPQPSKAPPKSEANVATRGSLAAAFAAAAAAKNIPLPAVQPDESHSAPVAVSDKETSGSKDAIQPDKNTDGPAQIAPAKNEPAAQAPVTFDNTMQTQPRAADNTIQLPQAAVTLTNNSGVAAMQAPHAASNIDVSLQVGQKDHASPPREPQVDLSTLAINIAAKSQGGSKHFDIRLDPVEMGRVEVRLSIDESGKATAHLSAEKPQTLALLQRDSTTLERTLKDSGLDFSQNGLNFSLKGQNQQHNGSDAQPRGTPLVVTATANPEPSLNPVNMRADNVRLDIHV